MLRGPGCLCDLSWLGNLNAFWFQRGQLAECWGRWVSSKPTLPGTVVTHPRSFPSPGNLGAQEFLHPCLAVFVKPVEETGQASPLVTLGCRD